MAVEEASPRPEEQPATASRREARPIARLSLWRNLLLPLAAIAAIAAAIWWLEYRPSNGDGRSGSGERFGPVELPAALIPAAMEVGPQEGKLAPDFLLPALDGGEVRLSDLRGKAVVINLWATWCKPCRKEIPQLIDAYNTYRDRGLVILAINLQESTSVVRPFAKDFGMNFPILLDRRGSVADKYRLLGLPTTYFVDRQGVVRSVFTGPFVEKVQGTTVQGAIEENELVKRIEESLR